MESGIQLSQERTYRKSRLSRITFPRHISKWGHYLGNIKFGATSHGWLYPSLNSHLVEPGQMMLWSVLGGVGGVGGLGGGDGGIGTGLSALNLRHGMSIYKLLNHEPGKCL